MEVVVSSAGGLVVGSECAAVVAVVCCRRITITQVDRPSQDMCERAAQELRQTLDLWQVGGGRVESVGTVGAGEQV